MYFGQLAYVAVLLKSVLGWKVGKDKPTSTGVLWLSTAPILQQSWDSGFSSAPFLDAGVYICVMLIIPLQMWAERLDLFSCDWEAWGQSECDPLHPSF